MHNFRNEHFFLYQYSCHETLTILILHIYPTRSSIFGQLISRHFLINPNKLLFSIHENYNINMAYSNQMIAIFYYFTHYIFFFCRSWRMKSSNLKNKSVILKKILEMNRFQKISGIAYWLQSAKPNSWWAKNWCNLEAFATKIL